MWLGGSEEVREAYGKNYYDAATEATLKVLDNSRPACKVYEVIDDLVDAVASTNPKVRSEIMLLC